MSETKKSRSRLPFEINGSVILLAGALILATIGLILANRGALPDSVMLWWPLALIVPSAFWFGAALTRRNPRGMVRSTVIIGLGASLLLAAQNIAPLGTTLVGVTLISVGTGILLRGLLLGRQTAGMN